MPETFARIGRLADEYSRWCADACRASSDDEKQSAARRFAEIGSAVRKLYAEHTSSCIAAVHCFHDKPVSSLHSIYSAFLIELLIPAFEQDTVSHKLLFNAALTANLGMYEFQDQWAAQTEAFSEEQKAQVHAHTEVSVQRLAGLGIDNPLWMTLVRQHHERADGGGYPRGRAGHAVLNGALLIGLIDRYLSFVMPRTSRQWVHPTVALKRIYEDSAAYRADNISIFIRRLGVYPPGTSVRLVNGEIAVVISHQLGRSANPAVVSIGTSADAMFDEPVSRDTSQPMYRVKGLYIPDLNREPNPARRVRSWV
jgi:hypothetical protein